MFQKYNFKNTSVISTKMLLDTKLCGTFVKFVSTRKVNNELTDLNRITNFNVPSFLYVCEKPAPSKFIAALM